MFVGGASFLLDLRRLFVAHLRLVDDRHVVALVLEPMGDRRIAPALPTSTTVNCATSVWLVVTLVFIVPGVATKPSGTSA